MDQQTTPPLGPWMAPQEWAIVLAVIEAARPVDVVEWGCGGSTLALLDLMPRRYPRAVGIETLLTIEHDPFWAEEVRKHAQAKEGRFTLLVVPPTEAAPPSASVQFRDWYARSETDSSLFAAYVAAGDRHCDLALVDGRARNFCLKLAWDRLRPGGVAILHDAQRTEYSAALAQWPGSVRRYHGWHQGQIATLVKA